MLTENTNKERILSREAAGAIIARRFCQDIAGGKVQACVTAGARCESIARYNAEAGRAASQQYGPTDVIVEAGAAVADNVDVMCDITGRAVLAAGVGNWVLGRVIGGSFTTAAGQFLKIRFDPASAFKL